VCHVLCAGWPAARYGPFSLIEVPSLLGMGPHLKIEWMGVCCSGATPPLIPPLGGEDTSVETFAPFGSTGGHFTNGCEPRSYSLI